MTYSGIIILRSGLRANNAYPLNPSLFPDSSGSGPIGQVSDEVSHQSWKWKFLGNESPSALIHRIICGIVCIFMWKPLLQYTFLQKTHRNLYTFTTAVQQCNHLAIARAPDSRAESRSVPAGLLRCWTLCSNESKNFNWLSSLPQHSGLTTTATISLKPYKCTL